MSHKINPKYMSVFTLAMLITGAIDSIRNLPATALFGNQLPFFFALSAVLFLIPVGLISAWLSSTNLEGGIYSWVKGALGPHVGFVAVWLQWINTMVWYPTILSFIAGTLAYLIDPSLAQHKGYIVFVILAVFWVLTLVNLKGVHASAKFASFCAIVGMLIPMGLIMLLAIIWVASGQPLQLHLTAHNMMPSIGGGQSWISLTAIMTSFLGMELAGVHIKHIKNPQRVFPRALLVSVSIICVTMILGSLSIGFVIPHAEIGLVDGVMQAFSNFFKMYHLSWMTDMIALMILIGSVGGMINWVISPAKGLLHAAKDGYLPKFLQKENKHGVAVNMMFVQAVLVSFVCLAFYLMPSVNGSYWLLTDLSTQLYMLMYVLMFVAAIVLKCKKVTGMFKVPFKEAGFWTLCIFGLLGCAITLLVGFFPPEGIDVGGFMHYEIAFVSGIVGMLFPALLLLFFVKQKPALNR